MNFSKQSSERRKERVLQEEGKLLWELRTLPSAPRRCRVPTHQGAPREGRGQKRAGRCISTLNPSNLYRFFLFNLKTLSYLLTKIPFSFFTFSRPPQPPPSLGSLWKPSTLMCALRPPLTNYYLGAYYFTNCELKSKNFQKPLDAHTSTYPRFQEHGRYFLKCKLCCTLF